MRVNLVRWIITVVAIAAALIHAYRPSIFGDQSAVTVILLVFACLPWLGGVIRNVELPGGIKLEFRDLQEARKDVEEAGLVPPKKRSERQKAGRRRHTYSFEVVANNDPNLVLAGLRIEIESRLRELAKSRNTTKDQKSLQRLAKGLVNCEVLTNDEASAISELLPLLDSAAHGAYVDDKAFEWALEFGPSLLDALEERLGEISIPNLLKQWRGRDGAAGADISIELSKALVRSPRAFVMAMRDDPSSFDTWLQRIQHDTFTICESRDETEDDLYTAYYERLKQLMQEALKSLLETEFHSEASRALSVLDRTDIHRIW